MRTKSKNLGFTLVELMVAVAIIVLLTGIIVSSLVSSKAKARDSKRVSDLAQIQLALEQYFDRCGQYPAPTGTLVDTTASNGCPSGSSVTLANYISNVPTPPSNATGYDYYVNAATPTDYVLHVALENAIDSLKDSLQYTAANPKPAWVTPNCYVNTNPASLDYCVGPK